MLVPLTDPNHQLAMLMIEAIAADQRRQARAAQRETGTLDDESPMPARRHAWSRLASVERDQTGKRVIRIFRAPAPAI